LATPQAVAQVSSSTALTSSLNPSVFGQLVNLKATVTSSSGTPTGHVTFMDGATSLGVVSLDFAGRAELTDATLAVGSHSLVASYSGDSSHDPSQSPILTQMVNPATGAATTTTLVSSPNPSFFGQPVTFTATVTSTSPGTPTGTVIFVHHVVIGTVTLDASAKATLTTSSIPVGSHLVSATYNGDSTFNPSTSARFIQVVSPPISFNTLAPCRVVDTRNPDGPLGGPALVAGAQRTFVLAGQCGVPMSARVISLNVTVTDATAMGDLQLFAAGNPVPGTPTIHYNGGQMRADNALVSLGVAGDLTVQCDQPSGTVQLILDVNGYLQ